MCRIKTHGKSDNIWGHPSGEKEKTLKAKFAWKHEVPGGRAGITINSAIFLTTQGQQAPCSLNQTLFLVREG